MTMKPDSFESILTQRYGRRQLLRAGLWGGVGLLLAGKSHAAKTLLAAPTADALKSTSSLTFKEVAKALTESHEVSQGYQLHLIARWGDALLPSAKPDDDFAKLTADEQHKCFGYNNDYISYLPLPYGSQSSDRALLHVNHEYTNAQLMFPGGKRAVELSPKQMRVEQEAHGVSVMEVRYNGSRWEPLMGSPYARRITATTPIAISGPAAGHPRMKTRGDPSGKRVLGTIGNCSGGMTPWGTVLVAEENFDGYFSGKAPGQEVGNHKRYQVAKRPYYGWSALDSRFDVNQTPNEPNRFGWIVEYDPYDVDSIPVKRTALGRFKHETATCTQTADGRLVVYSGDDDEFEYIYRFISKYPINKNSREKNRNLLDEGELSVAKFQADGSLQWLPLTHGKGPLIAKNGFNSQAEVMIETRRAADFLGATPMDRPEGIAIHPKTGEVFVAMTKNKKRKQTNIANPRAVNKSGHIVRFQPKAEDHGSAAFKWEMFILAGNPLQEQTTYNPEVTMNGWFSCPDNLTFDPQGRLWIATDGMESAHKAADGLYATDVNGVGEAIPKAFFRAPIGAESCSPAFTPDGRTLFLSIQHPAEGSSFDEPSTRWPDFDPATPPRPSVVAITKKDGGVIGS